MKKLIMLAGLAIVSLSASAQSRSSFLGSTSITGVSMTHISGNIYKLTVSPGANFVYNSVTYNIQDVFGVWALNNSNTGLAASGTTQNGWGYDESNNPDDIAGWKTNPPNALSNGSLTFTYSTINQANINQFGYHVRLTSGFFPGTSGNTGFVTATPSMVPEPASMAALGLGAVALIRRRKK